MVGLWIAARCRPVANQIFALAGMASAPGQQLKPARPARSAEYEPCDCESSARSPKACRLSQRPIPPAAPLPQRYRTINPLVGDLSLDVGCCHLRRVPRGIRLVTDGAGDFLRCSRIWKQHCRRPACSRRALRYLPPRHGNELADGGVEFNGSHFNRRVSVGSLDATDSLGLGGCAINVPATA